jgi:glutathione peroxidase
MRIPTMLCALAVVALAGAPLHAAVSSVMDVTMNAIDGTPTPLSKYKGQVIMLVNVASKCGNTPQYTALEALYDKYKDKGLVIIGVPANNFRGQEPGTDEEIVTFCMTKYDVSFPLLSKVSVKGNDICPLYQYLTKSSPKPGDVSWNFEKFLVGRNGEVVDRFTPKTKPDDAAVVAAIEKALAAQ